MTQPTNNQTPEPHGSVTQHVAVIAFVLLLIGAGVRGLVADDSRFGWGMYGRDMVYGLDYAWVLRDGSEAAFTPGGELQSMARRVLYPTDSRTHEPRLRRTRYAAGTMRANMQRYLQYMYDTRAPRKAVAARVTWRYWYDQTSPITGEPHVEVLIWPRERAANDGDQR